MIPDTRRRSRAMKRRPAGALALVVVLAFPVLATTGPAHAAPAGGRIQPAAAPSSDLLANLTGLLAQLLAPRSAAPDVPQPLVAKVAPSTVKVTGAACGLRLSGSGFSPAPDTVVTNAHVVAGTTAVMVVRADGRALRASVQIFDPDKDLAVLNVPELNVPSLQFGSAVPGQSAAVFGHPLGRAAVEVSPARVVRRATVDVGDIYDRPAAPRQIIVLDANLQPGDSGGPLVNSSGDVVGVAFAVANLRRSTAFAVASEEVTPVLARPRAGATSTGPCLA